MKIHDFLLGIIIAVAALVIFMVAKEFPDQNDGKPGAWLYPCALSIIFFGCGVVMSFKGLKHLKGEKLFVLNKELSSAGALNIIIVIAMVIFYIECSDYLGFLISMFIVIAVMLAMLKNKPWVILVTAPVATLVIYLIFSKGLLVPLPEGLLYF